ncbi:MAG TPA: hypothetical protein VKE24_13945 [Candidatus Acidoferrales bacterium]|nr:hypothetical protein [Candidatus Acidoferrales bacterium]
MTKQEFSEMLNTLAADWMQKNYRHAASFFSVDVKYGDPTRYQFNSRAELLVFFQNDEGYDQRTIWHTILFDTEQQIGAAEYTFEGTHRYHGVVLIKVSETGITHWREYQHISPLAWEEFVGITKIQGGS